MAGLFSRLQKRSIGHHPYCAAVVVAAGSASRMKGIDKIMTTLGGIPVLARTLQALEQCGRIDEIVVVTRTDLCAPVNILCREFGIQKVTAVVSGGATRAESVRCGLCAVSGRAELAAIHDGARPFISQELLERVLIAGAQTGAVYPGLATGAEKTASSRRPWTGAPCSPSRPRKYSRRTLSPPPSTTASKRGSRSQTTAPPQSTWASR